MSNDFEFKFKLTGTASWENSRQIETWIFEFRQKLTGTGANYDAFPAGVVGFQFWIEIRNCETILVKIVCKLLKSVKK